MGQVTVDFLATTSFARRPALWLKLMSDNRSTITYSPSFGYDLAARRINGEAVTLDLSRLRVAGIGGDMVRADVLESFAAMLSVAGFRRKPSCRATAWPRRRWPFPSSTPTQPIRVDSIDRHALKTEGRAVPADGARCAAASWSAAARWPAAPSKSATSAAPCWAIARVGRIFVNTPSLMSGYYHNDDATAAAIGADGFLDTGDMGYWLDGEIVITGRAKDLILHNGRNIWPQDIEWAAEQIEPLRSRRRCRLRGRG